MPAGHRCSGLGRPSTLSLCCARRGEDSDRILDAAALQDELARRMKLNLGGQHPKAMVVVGERGTAHRVTGRRAARRRACTMASAPTENNDGDDACATAMASGGAARAEGAASSAWTCSECGSVNATGENGGPYLGHRRRMRHDRREDPASDPQASFCTVCMHDRSRRPTRVGERFAGGRAHGAASSCGSAREVAHRRVSVTLAQLRGLEEPPEPTLTPCEWSVVEAQAKARNDEAWPCPICREPFQEETQVILSCSHVFHKTCLAAFERFLRTQERSCPLCRKVAYQKKRTRQGAAAWRQRCARRVQCAYRGYSARRAYRLRLRKHYSRRLGDPARRREFLSAQAAESAGQLAAAFESRGDCINRLFEELDQGLAFSREVFGGERVPPSSEFEGSHRRHSPESASADWNDREQGEGTVRRGHASESEREDKRWLAAWRRAAARGQQECPICMCEMEEGSDVLPISASQIAHGSCICDQASIPMTSAERPSATIDRQPELDHADHIRLVPSGVQRRQCRSRGQEKKGKERVLLSCSHVLHKTCLEAFEAFNIYEVRLCPVCRQDYDTAHLPVVEGCPCLVTPSAVVRDMSVAEDGEPSIT